MARLPLPAAEPVQLETLAEIARGGMGSVELCKGNGGRLDGRIMAVKRLHPEVSADPSFVNMFLDEAWMTAALKSPNVIRVDAWGKDEQGYFLAVELVQGVSLSRLIKESRAREEPFAERTVANICSQICAGLAAAHSLTGSEGEPLGLVHRDLTPGNILVSFDGVVKIADFGIAQAEDRLTRTKTGTMKGKPAYMAPEQARGKRVDARADLFSLGVLMFELLAGKRPWSGKSAFDVLMAVATKPPPSLREIRPSVNQVFVDIVERCIQKTMDLRPRSAHEIVQKLDAWRASKGFADTDQQSLATFVQRNTPKQMRWFRDALGGSLDSTAPSFKDLEAKIDEARESHRPSMHRPRPAAGRPADPFPTPRPAAGRPPSPAAGIPAVSDSPYAHSVGGPSPYPGTPLPSGQSPAAIPSGVSPAAIPSGQSPAAIPSGLGPPPVESQKMAETRAMATRIREPAPREPAPREPAPRDSAPPDSDPDAAPTRVRQPSDGLPQTRRQSHASTEFMAVSPFAMPQGARPDDAPLPPPRRQSSQEIPAQSAPSSSPHAGLPLPPERQTASKTKVSELNETVTSASGAPASAPAPRSQELAATLVDPTMSPLSQPRYEPAAPTPAAGVPPAHAGTPGAMAPGHAAVGHGLAAPGPGAAAASGGRAWLWILLLLVVLGGGGAAAFVFRASLGF